jgi:hypothetical protein
MADFEPWRVRLSAPPPQARGHGRLAGQRAMLRHRLCFEKPLAMMAGGFFNFRVSQQTKIPPGWPAGVF